jgi:hypothetical protein
MHTTEETDDELLALAFPDYAGQIKSWRAINGRLDELCRDFLTVKRSDLEHPNCDEGNDVAFLNHLREAMDDLSKDIEILLRRMSVATAHVHSMRQPGKDWP